MKVGWSIGALNTTQLYIGWNDVTVICGHITISVLCGNTAYCVTLSGEDTSRYLNKIELEMWANDQIDGRPAEYRWRPLLNAAKFGLPHYSSAVQ